MACRRCGNCCNKALLIMEGKNILADAKYRDLAQWYSLHHCQVKVEEGTGSLAIFIPLVCQKLGFNPDTGESFCADYENRPQICRDYLCGAAEKD